MLIEIILLVASFIAYQTYKVFKAQQRWQKIGISVPNSTFPFGNVPFFNLDTLKGTKNVNDTAREQYFATYGERYYGTYFLGNKSLVISDPELAKQILVKNFDSFVDRLSPETNKLLSGSGTKTDKTWANQLVQVNGGKWRRLRSTVSPIFTSGKMKSMFPLINEVNGRLLKSIEDELRDGKCEVELKKHFGKFSMDTIASCAFGVDAGSFTDPNSKFVLNAKNVFRRNGKDFVKLLFALVPFGLEIMGLLGISLLKPEETGFFYDVVVHTLKQRGEGKFKRNDFIDMMIEAMKEDPDVGDKEHEELTLVSTALVMLIAGYDTTAQTLTFCAYELAKHPEIQNKLRTEIDDVMAEGDGHMPDYTTIQTMEYLDMVLHETLRLHPAAGVLSRGCIKEYKIPDSDITIPVGEEILINAVGIHSDSKYYPEPLDFNPEHFSKEAKANRHQYTFLGFGQGPRNCVGMRFALLEAKMALVLLLSKFRLECCSKTVDVVELDPTSQLGSPKNDLWIQFEDRSLQT